MKYFIILLFVVFYPLFITAITGLSAYYKIGNKDQGIYPIGKNIIYIVFFFIIPFYLMLFINYYICLLILLIHVVITYLIYFSTNQGEIKRIKKNGPKSPVSVVFKSKFKTIILSPSESKFYLFFLIVVAILAYSIPLFTNY